MTFTQALRKATAHRGDLQRLAEQTGLTAGYLSKLKRGQSVVGHATAVLIADALHMPSLAALSLAARSKACTVCVAPFVDNSSQLTRVYCKAKCQRAAEQAKRRGQREHAARLTLHRLADFQAAVAAFCRDCTAGDGICRTGDCPLRAVSPLPFIPMSRVSRRVA